MEKELKAYAQRQQLQQVKPLVRSKVESSIKQFVRLSVRKVHKA